MLTNWYGSAAAEASWSKVKTGTAAQSEAMKPRRDGPLLLLEHLAKLDLLLLLGFGALGECGAAAGLVALGAQHLGERIVRAGVGGVEPDGFAQGGFGAGKVALLLQGRTQ